MCVCVVDFFEDGDLSQLRQGTDIHREEGMYSEVLKHRHELAEALAVLGVCHGWATEGEGQDLMDAGWGADGEDGVHGPGVVGRD